MNNPTEIERVSAILDEAKAAMTNGLHANAIDLLKTALELLGGRFRLTRAAILTELARAYKELGLLADALECFRLSESIIASRYPDLAPPPRIFAIK